GKADIFAGQLLPVPHGFILYLRGETYVVNGSGYIHAQEVLPNTDLGDEDISTTLPLDYVIEGHGPVEGKMVVQFFAPMPKHEVNGDREILAAVDGFFGDDNRYDEVTLYSGITNELTEILGVLANHDPDKAN